VASLAAGSIVLTFKFPEQLPDPSLKPQDVDLSIPLNRRKGRTARE